MEVKRILWPTDFSGSAEKALPYVNSLTEKYDTEVHVLYVIEELGIHESWYGEFEKSHIKKIHEWEDKKAKKRLDEVCDQYLQGCPLYIKHVAIGDPAQEILKLVDKEKVVGILSKRNFTRKMILKKKTSKNTLVRDIMTSKVIQTTPNQKVGKCLSLMTKNRFRHIPVLEKGRLVGILSIEDIKSIL